MKDSKYLAALYAYTPFGPVRTKLLLTYFGSPEAAWKASLKKLLETGLNKKTVANFERFRNNFNFNNYFERLKKYSIDYLTLDDPGYPSNLAEIEDAPPVLYIRGTLSKQDTCAVAIVGSRHMSSYGREVAEKFARELSGLGVTIVSGLALGIDAAAHKGSLEGGGRGIVVLASGLDTVSPYTNRKLAFEIIKNGGAIVSEYPLGFPPFRTNFAVRNRLISGLSKAVIVVEGRMKSGTFHTVSAALNQGRPVFAVPGQITSPLSEAPNYLIKNGAKLITTVQDVLEELDLQLQVDHEAVNRILPSDKIEVKLFDILADEPLHLDEIVRISGLKVAEVSGKLTVMELKGMLKNMGKGVYKKIS